MTYQRTPTKAYETIELAMKGIEGKIGKVGWVARKQYPGTQMTTAAVAAIAENGYPTRNIPARPVFKPTIREHKEEWKRITDSESKKILRGQQTGTGMLETIGLKAAGDVRATIAALQEPPLSPRTIAARRRRRANKAVTGNLTKPLVDTGVLLNSCTNTVENE